MQLSPFAQGRALLEEDDAMETESSAAMETEEATVQVDEDVEFNFAAHSSGTYLDKSQVYIAQ